MLEQAVRPTGFVARLGGDEFAVLLEDTEDEEALRVLERLRQELTRRVAQSHPSVTAGLGAVTLTEAHASADEMQQRADHAMYAVKTSGKDRLLHERA